jgi:hypothetical protein
MSSIFAFNVDTKECSIIDSKCPTIERMQGDEEEVLSFRHEDSIYRLPLRFVFIILGFSVNFALKILINLFL